ncbi:MAG: DUF1858 domain-containing protein [Oscillospiraceae bacterium]|nr:DUF1858 domain-containing protein [Oscillospiraceae bacterium]
MLEKLFKRKKRFIVTKDMSVHRLIRMDKEIPKIFAEAGMHCIGCPSAMDESLEMACLVHGADTYEIMEKVQAVLNRKFEEENAEEGK